MFMVPSWLATLPRPWKFPVPMRNAKHQCIRWSKPAEERTRLDAMLAVGASYNDQIHNIYNYLLLVRVDKGDMFIVLSSLVHVDMHLLFAVAG